MALEDEVRSLTQQVQRMVDMQSLNKGPTNTSSPGPGLSTLDSKAAGIGNTFVDVGSKLMSGTATTGDAFKSVSFILDKFGGAVGNVTSNAISQLGSGIINVNNTMKETGKFGVTLGQDLAGFNEAVMKGYLTMDEFQGIIRENSQAMAGLGAGMDKSAKAFLGVLADVETTDVAKDLKALGMSSKELADITQISMMNKRGIDLSDARSKEAAVRAATDLAVQLDLSAQITGKSREQAEADLKAQKENAQLQAAMALKGPEFAKNFDSATAMLPKSAQKLMTELATGGVRTQEGVELSATYGGEVMDSFQKLNDAIEHGTEEQVARAREEAMAALARRNADKSVQETTMLLGDSFMKYGTVFNESAALQGSIQAKQKEVFEKTGETISEAEAMKQLTADIQSKQKGEQPEGVTARTINQVDNLGKTLGAVSAQGLKEFNDKMLKAASKDGGINAFENKLKEFASPEGMIKGLKDAGTGAAEAIKNAAKLPVTYEGPKEATPTEKTGRAEGSLGTVGKWLEDWGVGTPVTLHGKEGVVTEEQFKMIGTQFQSMMKSVSSNLSFPSSDLGNLGVTGFGAGNMPKFDSKIFDMLGENFKKLSDTTDDLINEMVTGSDKTEDSVKSIASLGAATQDFTKSVSTQSKDIKSISPTAVNVKKPAGVTDVISDMFFGIGNIAGKMYDKATTTAPPTLGNNVKYELPKPKTPDSEQERLKLENMKAASKITQSNISQADALKPKITSATPNAITSDIANWQKNLKQTVATDAAKQKAEAEKKKQESKKEPVKKEPELQKEDEKKTTPNTTIMSDIKEEIVKLNTNIRELISHTDKVADGVSKQVSATKSMNNRLG